MLLQNAFISNPIETKKSGFEDSKTVLHKKGLFVSAAIVANDFTKAPVLYPKLAIFGNFMLFNLYPLFSTQLHLLLF